jgi:hypothetical protein
MQAALARLKARFHRTIAAAGAVLVLFLGVAATNPTLHHWLHADLDGASDVCASVLLCTGFTAATFVACVRRPSAEWSEIRRQVSAVLYLQKVESLRPPGRGPPRD